MFLNDLLNLSGRKGINGEKAPSEFIVRFGAFNQQGKPGDLYRDLEIYNTSLKIYFVIRNQLSLYSSSGCVALICAVVHGGNYPCDHSGR